MSETILLCPNCFHPTFHAALIGSPGDTDLLMACTDCGQKLVFEVALGQRDFARGESDGELPRNKVLGRPGSA